MAEKPKTLPHHFDRK